MQKSDLRRLLGELQQQFESCGGEVVRYASPSNPTPIKTGTQPKPPANLKAEAWQEFIQALEAGEYVPDLTYQEAPRRSLVRHKPRPNTGPVWRDDDGRGYRNLKRGK